MATTFVLADDQKTAGTAVGLDSQGNPTGPLPSGATAVWSTSDDTVLTVTQDPADPLSATVTTTGKLGLGVQVSVAVTLPGATAPIVGVGTIDVHAGQLVTIGVNFGPAVPR